MRVLLGSGAPLFVGGGAVNMRKLTDSLVIPEGVVNLVYKPE
jgi:hypothetical protein